MKESKFYQEIVEEGRQQGLEEGREEGRREGKLWVRRNSILHALEIRFGAPVAAEFEPAVTAIDDPEVLGRLLLLAVFGSLTDGFRAALRHG
jgi:predicted transposase YdaD